LHIDNFRTAEAIDWLQRFLRLGFPIDGHVESFKADVDGSFNVAKHC
jgi:hypothetical protein